MFGGSHARPHDPKKSAKYDKKTERLDRRTCALCNRPTSKCRGHASYGHDVTRQHKLAKGSSNFGKTSGRGKPQKEITVFNSKWFG